MKAILIDDEEDARRTLELMIKEFCTGVEILGQADSVIEGLKLIRNVQPELVFLDIEMPGGTGFDLLQAVPAQNFKVIFTTAYDQYAIKAFKFNAFDYLVKPINAEELVDTVTRVQEYTKENVRAQNANFLRSVGNEKFERLSVFSDGAYHLIDIDNLVYLKSEGAYTYIFADGGIQLLSSKNLRFYDDFLTEHGFYRCNKSHLVNLKKITQLSNEDGGTLIMDNNNKVPVSKNRKIELKQILGI